MKRGKRDQSPSSDRSTKSDTPPSPKRRRHLRETTPSQLNAGVPQQTALQTAPISNQTNEIDPLKITVDAATAKPGMIYK